MKRILAYGDPEYGYVYRKGKYQEEEKPDAGSAATPYLCASCGGPLDKDEVDLLYEMLEIDE